MSSNNSTTGDTTVSALTSDTRNTSSGRGRGGGRGRGRGGGRGAGSRGAPRSRGTGFKGTTAEMNGHVFECYDEQTDRRQYAKTVEAFENYVKKTLKFSEDLSPLFATDSKLPEIEKPAKPGKTADGKDPDEADIEIWKEEVKEMNKRKRVLRSNLSAMHAIIWGQCSEAMKARLKSLDEYEERTAADDCKWLLSNIQAITMQFDEKHHGYTSMLDATAGFLNCRQQVGQSVANYVEALKNHIDTIEYHGGTIAMNINLAPETASDGRVLSEKERVKIARDCTIGAALIRGTDRTRYGTLQTTLMNQYCNGKDEYPTDLSSALGMLGATYQTPTNAPRPNRHNQNYQGGQDDQSTGQSTGTQATAPTAESSGITFAQTSAGVPGTNGILHEGVTCYRCDQTGHYACDCPADQGTGSTAATLLQHGLMLTQGDPGIDPSWILLDSQSTISVFHNADMLRNIRPSGRVLRAITNGGFQESKLIGDFPNLGEVWFNPDSIANILSLSHVRSVCRVTMDTADEPCLVVHRVDGSRMKFREHPCGLYVFSPPSSEHNTPTDACTMLNTVKEQKKLLTPRDVSKAAEARRLYRMLGRPSEAEFLKLLSSHFLHNCPVTAADAKRATIIYGPDVAALKGKTTRSGEAARVPCYESVPIPPHIRDHYTDVVLCVDFFLCSGTGFYPHHFPRHPVSNCDPRVEP